MAGKNAVVGKVSVKVFPDTKHFKDRLKKDLQAWANKPHNQVKYQVQVDERALKVSALKALTNLNRELRTNDKYKVQFRAEISEKGQVAAVKAARASLQRHASAWSKAKPVKFDAVLAEIDTDVKLNRDSLRKVEDDLRDWRKRVSPLKIYVQPEMLPGASAWVSTRLRWLTRPREVLINPVVNPAAAIKVGTILAALSGGRAVWNIGKDLWDSLKEIDKAVPKFALVSNALTNLTSYLMAATSNMFTFGSSLASISASALTLPGILGGMAIGVGATVAAFRDFNDVLPEVKDQLSEMQDLISSKFWQQAENPMRNFFDRMMPQFTSNMGRTGSALGGFFGGLSTSLVGVFDKNIRQMFDDLNESIDISTKYTDNFAGVLATLGRVGAASLPRLAEWFGGISKDFDGWLRDAEADGRLQGWIDTGIENLHHLGDVIADTGRTFRGLARAMEKAGGSTLEHMADTMERVAKAVNKASFQNAMTKAFRGAHTAMTEIADRSGPAFDSFMRRLAHTLSNVLPSAGRAAGTALDAIFGALDQDKVQRSLEGLFDKIEVAFNKLAPSMPALARALASIVDVVGDIAVAVADVLVPAIDAIGPKIEEIARIAGPVAQVLGKGLGGAVEILGKGLSFLPAQAIIAVGGLMALSHAKKSTDGLTAKLTAKVKMLGTSFTTTAKQGKNFALGMRGVVDPSLRQTANSIGHVAGQNKQFVKTAVMGTAAMAGLALASSGVADKFGLSNTASMALMGTLAGPWGAAAGGAVGLLMDLGAQSAKTTDAIKFLNQAVRDGDLSGMAAGQAALNQKVGETTGLMVGLKSSLPGVAAAFKLFGDNTDEAMDALAHSTEVQRGYKDSLAEIAQLMGEDFKNPLGHDILPTLENMAGYAERVAPAMKALGITIEQLGSSGGEHRDELTAQIADWITTSESAKGRTQNLAEAIASVGDASMTTAQAADNLSNALSRALSPAIDSERATISWKEALQGLTQQLNEKAGIKGFSQGAMDNKNAVIGAVEALNRMMVANAEAGATGQELARQMANGTEAIVKQAAAAGMSEGAVRNYLSTLGLTPERIETVLETVGLSKEQRKINRYQEAMKGLPDRLKTIIETAGYPLTRRQVKDLAKAYDKTPKKVQTKIEALVTTAKSDIDNIDKDMLHLNKRKASPKVTTDDQGKKGRSKVKDDLEKLDKFVAKPRVQLMDETGSKYRALMADLAAIPRTITTHHRIVTSRSGGGGGGSGGGGSDDLPFSPRGRETSQMVNNFERVLTRLSDTMRTKLVKQSDKWLEGLRDQVNAIPAGISKAFVKARNDAKNSAATVKRLEKEVKNASNKAAKEQAKKRLDAAKKEAKEAKAKFDNIKKLRKGWNGQNAEINAALELYQDMNSELLSAQGQLDGLIDRIAGFKSGLLDSYKSWASVLNAPMSTFSSMEKHLENVIKDMTEFNGGMDQLVDMGLDKSIVEQLASEGPEALDFIKSILAEGQAGIERLNELWGKVEGLGTGTAEKVGDYVFADELQAAKDKVDSLLATMLEMKPLIAKASKDLMTSISKPTKAHRKKIVSDLEKIIEAYKRVLDLANKATGATAPVGSAAATGYSSRVNTNTQTVNNTYNINLPVSGTSSTTDLFAAGNRVKAVIGR